jgi:hypothetical protein
MEVDLVATAGIVNLLYQSRVSPSIIMALRFLSIVIAMGILDIVFAEIERS